MTVKYFDDAKKALKKEMAESNILIYMVTLVSVCELPAGLEKLVNKEFAMAIMCFVFAVVGCALSFFMFKSLSRCVENKIEFLKDMHEIDKTYKEMDIKACKCELERTHIELIEAQKEIKIWKSRAKINGDDKSLEEILKEQENGDTKECECELEQGDTMS